MGGREADTAKIVKVLDHPARRRIVELLGTKGPLPWKELASELGVGTGALYYHLDTLEGIVSRDSSKRYVLTKPGQAVFAYLKDNPVPTHPRDFPSLNSVGWPKRYLEGLFAPRSLLYRMTSNVTRSLAVLVVFSVLFLSLMTYFGEAVRLFYVSPSRDVLNIVGSYSLSLLALVVISYVAMLAISHERPQVPALAASSVLSFLPVIAFGSLLAWVTPLSRLLGNQNVATVVFVFFQAWSATILGAGVSISSGVRVERSIVISLIVLYATMILIFIQGGASLH